MCWNSGKFRCKFELYDALTMLQHRGQDAAGMVTDSHGEFINARVKDWCVMFFVAAIWCVLWAIGVGHCRYPTAGSSGPAMAQPLYVNSPYGICIAHNGNLTNADELRKDIFRTDLRHLNTDSDSEVLLNVFAHELQVRENWSQPVKIFLLQ